MASLSLLILTRNESVHIRRAILSKGDLSADVFVIDSGSSDDTVEIARSLGAHVVEHPFENYARQLQWALDTLPITTDWVMRLDADETLTPELVAEISQKLSTLPKDVTGVIIRLSYVFMGRRIANGGRRLSLLRITRRNAAKVEDRWMDEHMVLLHGKAATFDHEIIDSNLKDLSNFIDKHNGYATREAIDYLQQKYSLPNSILRREKGLSKPARRTRSLKRLYYLMPLGIRPIIYFVYRYVFRFGFADGAEGLVYHFLQGLWYRFLVDCKILEYDRFLAKLNTTEQRSQVLAGLTGHSISFTDRSCAESVPGQ